MITLDDVLDLFFETLKNCIESITLPTGSNLVPTFIYSFVIFVASVVSRLSGHITFVDWRGALIATILLLILALIERKGVNEISRLYRAVKSGTAALKGRAKGSGTPVEAHRGTNPGDEVPEEVGGPPVRDGEV